MRIFTAQRLATDGYSTIGQWSENGLQLCKVLEPGALTAVHPRIPAGRYPLRLRTVGDKHAQYLKRFGPAFHKGMIEIAEVPGRTAIEFHIGNSVADTLGCSLAGQNIVPPDQALSSHWEVAQSEVAYRRAYPVLRDAVLGGTTFLQILDIGKGASGANH